MEGLAFWSVAVLAAVAVGLSKGGLQSVSVLAVPILSLVISPVAAAGLLLPVFIVSDVFGVWAYRHSFDRRVLAIGIAGMLLGTAVGWTIAEFVAEWAVRLIVGVVGASFAVHWLLNSRRDRPAQQVRVGRGLFWTTIAGFTSFVSHSGAPPWQVWVLPLKLPKLVFAGTTTLAFAIINAVKLVPYFFLGQLGLGNLKVALMLAVPAVLSVFVGLKLVKIMPERLFFTVVTWALLGVSLKLIWDGLMGA